MAKVRRFARFVVIAVALTLALAAVGYVPTQRRVGSAAFQVIATGCGISLVASICGAGMLLLPRSISAGRAAPVILLAMGVRLLITALIATAMLVAEFVPTAPLLVWVAVSYVMLLVADTRFAVSVVGGEVARPRIAEDRQR